MRNIQQDIRNINEALAQVFAGQRCIADIKEPCMSEADFFNHLLEVFASEKTIKVNIQEFMFDSISTLVANFNTGIDATTIINIDENAKQNLKTITFFNMLLYGFEFMFNYIRVEDTCSIACSMSREGVIIDLVGILRNSKEYKFRHPSKYTTECPSTEFLVFHSIALLAKQNNYVFTVLQDDSSFSFRFAPQTKEKIV